MKIFTSKQIKELDQQTITEQKISSLELMERAAQKCTRWLSNHFSTHTHFTLFCGLGNNGDDGLAIARMLIKKHYKIAVYVVQYDNKTSKDFKSNLDLLAKSTQVHYLQSKEDFPCIAAHSVIIDSVLGVGLNRPLSGVCKYLIDFINSLKNIKIAIDIPTGLPSEIAGFHQENTILKADYTLTFEQPKLSFLLPETGSYVGQWKLLSINLSKKHKEKLATDFFYLQAKDLIPIVKKRAAFSHKGTYGHTELIGGSLGKMGAIVLATKASLKIGAGLATAHTPFCGMQILQISVPEAMWTGTADCEFYLAGVYKNQKKTIGIGPGMGTHPDTESFLLSVLQTNQKPMVLDADALNILAKNKNWISLIPKGSILTPHPKEFERLVGNFNSDYEKKQLLVEFAKKNQCIVVLKGAYTAIGNTDGTIYFNSTGNAGMATGGSGDVLTGMITGLLAQNYSPLHAAMIGVYIHGLAGDLAIKEQGMLSITATDLVKYIEKATLHI
ncbi:bifunctional ADP-dependent NAD(P)H-hydrate dehydratase/NAD(P)H-hydrate epimerase [Ochrovirga pacifica]|uniref:bifunctional ADP-dependent NAD(P)H-hydrate dehydratase/NAD(P)H-hydrate epimerase n=1 Tax=Ochrovirga pacifica TaxID=1042376 RepID=UPI0002557BBF|nr:bifunctional ADP-dependent NAD(P)H-hydrate dehydratase/NAD(P)H-hydrate epimerase [Ochrovirga pacifica]